MKPSPRLSRNRTACPSYQRVHTSPSRTIDGAGGGAGSPRAAGLDRGGAKGQSGRLLPGQRTTASPLAREPLARRALPARARGAPGGGRTLGQGGCPEPLSQCRSRAVQAHAGLQALCPPSPPPPPPPARPARLAGCPSRRAPAGRNAPRPATAPPFRARAPGGTARSTRRLRGGAPPTGARAPGPPRQGNGPRPGRPGHARLSPGAGSPRRSRPRCPARGPRGGSAPAAWRPGRGRPRRGPGDPSPRAATAPALGLWPCGSRPGRPRTAAWPASGPPARPQPPRGRSGPCRSSPGRRWHARPPGPVRSATWPVRSRP